MYITIHGSKNLKSYFKIVLSMNFDIKEIEI